MVLPPFPSPDLEIFTGPYSNKNFLARTVNPAPTPHATLSALSRVSTAHRILLEIN